MVRDSSTEKEQPVSMAVPSGTFAELVGVDPNTVRAWVSAGLPAERDGRSVMIALASGFQWVRAKDRAALEALRAATDPEGAKHAKLKAEAQLKEMDVAEREGKLVVAADVESEWAQALVSFREAVMSVAGNAVQSGIIPAAKEAELEELCREALTVLRARLKTPEGAE